MKQLLICLAISLSLPTLSQEVSKKLINQDAYDSWNSIKQTKWSKNGEILTYQIQPAKGDSWLYFLNAKSLKKDSIFKGNNCEIHYQSKFAVFSIKPGYDTIRTLKLADTKSNKLPKDSLGIYWFENDSLTIVPQVKSYKISEEGDWLAYLIDKDDRSKCPEYKKWQIFKKKRKCDRPKTTGHSLTVLNPINGQSSIIHQVVNYDFNKKGDILFYSTSYKGESDSISLYALDLNKMNTVQVISNQLDISSFAIDEQGSQLAFTTTTDTNEIKTYQLAYWTLGDSRAKIIVDTNSAGLNDGWAVSEYSNTYFSKNGEYIYFGTNIKVEQEPEDSLLDSEKAKVDIWSWTDKKTQPQQLRQLRRTKKASFNTNYNIANQKLIHLESKENERVFVNSNINRQSALGRDTDKYLKSNSWDFPWKADYFITDLTTGKKELILEKQAYFPSLSPSGKYLAWYNGSDSCWMSTNIKEKTTINLTKNISAKFYSDNNGNPSNPFPEGSIGWSNNQGIERILIQSEYDIYELNPADAQEKKCFTQELGGFHKVKFSLFNFDKDSAYINPFRSIIKGVDLKTKNEFFVNAPDFHDDGMSTLVDFPRLLDGDHAFLDIQKAEQSDFLMVRPMNVRLYPDIFLMEYKYGTYGTPIKPFTKITSANPQQTDYNWASVEQVKWQSYKGLKLDGLLYKPEDFDSTKQYPMIVYFYEKYDDRLHNYHSPRPTASIIYPTEYASNGYIVFIPNILYTPGHPAKSAFDCIVSGTDYLTEKYKWIDTTKLALQGQSWGGYQTAQLVTMTGKYACGMAGAPVSNMFSAYGGIRWGSGMSRMFQYEKTQSRIGCTIWDCPELYIENSPIFGLPKVTTPLLIMHNDNDGAVPWYQGIEMFMGLRRLEKPVWLLNYNGDAHNLMQNANREDLSLRMKQFFDYYLKDSPMPLWMKNGVPAIEKGDPSNLELE
ncbi:MAG: alpha/beta hydrolase family protein [Crocinitomicaceae bacterium]